MAADIAALGFEIDPRPLDAATGSLNRMATAAKGAAQSATEVGKASTAAVSQSATAMQQLEARYKAVAAANAALTGAITGGASGMARSLTMLGGGPCDRGAKSFATVPNLSSSDII